MNIEEELKKIVLKHLPDQQYFLTEIVARPAGSKTKISVFLDGDRGIDIDVCAQMSRKIGGELDDLDLLKHPYTLMVSSPGLDRPLKLLRQYRKNLGKEVKIRLKDDQLKQGTLKNINKNHVVIEETTGSTGTVIENSIPFGEIETTHVLVSF